MSRRWLRPTRLMIWESRCLLMNPRIKIKWIWKPNWINFLRLKAIPSLLSDIGSKKKHLIYIVCLKLLAGRLLLKAKEPNFKEKLKTQALNLISWIKVRKLWRQSLKETVPEPMKSQGWPISLLKEKRTLSLLTSWSMW